MEILNPILANNWLDPPGLGNKALPPTLFTKGFIRPMLHLIAN